MRVFLALLLGLALATAGHPSTVRGNWPIVQEDEQQLSPEEEQEARDLLARFEERLLATNDFGPIVDELFVGDFEDRLWQVSRDSLPWGFMDLALIAYANRAELRRFYVASMSFYALYFRLTRAAEALKKGNASDDDEAKFVEALSPEVINVLLGDPTIAKLARKMNETEEDDGAGAEGDSDETGVIKTPQQLEGVSSTLEKANELLRKRLASMTAAAPATPAGDGEAKDEPGSRQPSATTLDEDEFGYAKDTRVIHADILGFCVTMIRIDGRLKILSAVLYVD